jgi:large subunit ribosomal protein L13
MPRTAVHHRPTFQAKGDFQHSWYIADVDGKTLGRAATKIADVLRGKKWQIKLYRDHSLFPGGLQTKTAEQLMQRHPADLIKRAVWGMMPKGPLGRRIYKKLKVYTGAEHPHAAQQPKPLKLA